MGRSGRPCPGRRPGRPPELGGRCGTIWAAAGTPCAPPGRPPQAPRAGPASQSRPYNPPMASPRVVGADAVDHALHEFMGVDDGRSVAVHTVRGPALVRRLRADEVRPAASLLKVAVVL